VILAGGRSRRMGEDKALLELRGIPLIQRAKNLLQPWVSELVISANLVEKYRFLGLPVIPDVFPGQGPMAGIHAAMSGSALDAFLVLACDMPCVTPALLTGLLQDHEGVDLVVPVTSDGRTHPLCGLYRRSCLAEFHHRLLHSQNRLMDVFKNPALKVKFLHPSGGSFRDSDLTNINTKSDLSVHEKAGLEPF